MKNIRKTFGNIDIYLFDQILKGRIAADAKILDAGCGGGRNIFYFLQNGFEVFAIDQNPEAIEQIRHFARILAPHLPSENFQISPVEQIPFPDAKFDLVISSAVLHFAENREHFDAMLNEMWRTLKPNGILFARLASSDGIENLLTPTENGRYDLPDGSERFLVNLELLLAKTNQLNANLLDPIKTTNVQNLRCMTTWVLSKKV